MATNQVRTIFAGIGEGNQAAPEVDDFSVSASSEAPSTPAENLRDVFEMARPWQSATAATEESIEWTWNGRLVRASSWGLFRLVAPELSEVRLELFSASKPGSGTVLLDTGWLPTWWAYLSPSSSSLLEWGEFLWGGRAPSWVVRNFPRDFIHVNTGSDGRPEAIPHRSGRYRFRMAENAGDNPLGYWRAGYFDVSLAYSPSRPIEWDRSRGFKSYGRQPVEGPSGVVRGSGGGVKRVQTLRWRLMPDDEILHYFDNIQADHQTRRPFVVVPQLSRPWKWWAEAGLYRLRRFFDTRPEQAFEPEAGDDDGPSALWSAGAMEVEQWI